MSLTEWWDREKVRDLLDLIASSLGDLPGGYPPGAIEYFRDLGYHAIPRDRFISFRKPSSPSDRFSSPEIQIFPMTVGKVHTFSISPREEDPIMKRDYDRPLRLPRGEAEEAFSHFQNLFRKVEDPEGSLLILDSRDRWYGVFWENWSSKLREDFPEMRVFTSWNSTLLDLERLKKKCLDFWKYLEYLWGWFGEPEILQGLYSDDRYYGLLAPFRHIVYFPHLPFLVSLEFGASDPTEQEFAVYYPALITRLEVFCKI